MMRRRGFSGLAILALSVLSAPLEAQVPAAAQQARQRKVEAKDAQRAASHDATIGLGPTFPADAFKDFDVPFPVASWFCDAYDTSAATNPAERFTPDAQKKSTLDADCQTKLADAVLSADVRIVHLADLDPHASTAEIRVQIVGEGGTYHSVTPGAPYTVPLRTLKTYAIGDRVNILIFAEENNQFVPSYGVALTFEQVPRLDLAPARDVTVDSTTEHQISVRLDRTGVATPRFLNQRWPVYLGPPAPRQNASAISEADWQEHASLVFNNRVADRQFIVTFSGIKEEQRWSFLAAGLQLSHCQDGVCQATIAVPPGSKSERRVPVKLLRAAYVNKNGHASAVSFDVELFHADVQLANPRGFFSLVPYSFLEEAVNDLTWTVSATGQFGSTPDLSDLKSTPDDPAQITDTAARGQGNDLKFSGTARLGLTKSLGSKANGEFELQLKSGDFGVAPEVKATKYRLNVFGVRGVTFSGGLYDIAEPSEAIALSESGESVSMHFHFVDVSQILVKHVPKRQPNVLKFEDSTADRDHWETFVQVRSAPGLTWSHGELDLYGLYGRKHAGRCVNLIDAHCPAEAAASASEVAAKSPAVFELGQSYTTAGFELLFGFGEGFSGSWAAYHSRLKIRNFAEGAVRLSSDEGRGTVTLATLAWTKYDPSATVGSATPALFTIRGQFGAGSGPETRDTNVGQAVQSNDAYLGDTAAFAPDELFLGLLAPAIQTTRGQVGAGLANKTYAGVLFSTPRLSPLRFIANRMHVPGSDVDATATTFKFHQYRFVTPVNGSHAAGFECNANTSIDSPAGVTYSIDLAGFWPGEALTTSPTASLTAVGITAPGPLVRGFQWSAAMKITVKM